MATEIQYETTPPGMSAMDYREHERTYSLFLGLAKWVCISVAVVLILMAIFLTGSDPSPVSGPNAPPPTATPATGGQPAGRAPAPAH
jgi:hypothetical protein